MDFSEKVIVPGNYSNFNDSVLKIQVIDPNINGNLTWSIEDFTETDMKI